MIYFWAWRGKKITIPNFDASPLICRIKAWKFSPWSWIAFIIIITTKAFQFINHRNYNRKQWILIFFKSLKKLYLQERCVIINNNKKKEIRIVDWNIFFHRNFDWHTPRETLAANLNEFLIVVGSCVKVNAMQCTVQHFVILCIHSDNN